MDGRFWEVDSARGIAILMMLVSNLLFDLYFFAGYAEFYSGFWVYFARATAGLFLLIAGLSLTLSYSRVKNREGAYRKYIKRGLKIFCIGLALTAVSWLAIGNNFIVFGMLHLIGLSIVLVYPLLRVKYASLVLGIVLFAAGAYVQTITWNNPWLLWLGIKTPGFSSVDYTPIIPWLGFVLIGIFLGNTIYPDGKKRLKDVSAVPARFLSFLGRHSLKIYLAHQPVFVGAIILIQNIL